MNTAASITSSNHNINLLQNTIYPLPPPLTVISNNINDSSTTVPSCDKEDITEGMTTPPPLKPINGFKSTSPVNVEKVNVIPLALLRKSLHPDDTAAALKKNTSLEIIQCTEGDEIKQKHDDDNDDCNNMRFVEETKQKNYRCGICCLQTETQEAMLLHLNFHSPNNFNLNMATDYDDQLEIIPIQTIITEETNDGDNDYGNGELMDNNNKTENEEIYTNNSRKLYKNCPYNRKCNLCSKNAPDISVFNSRVSYAIHLLNCHAKSKIDCKQCKTKFRYKYQLSLHKKLLKCKKIKSNPNYNSNNTVKHRIMSQTAASLVLKIDDGFKLNNNNNDDNYNNNKCKRLNELIMKCSRRLQKI